MATYSHSSLSSTISASAVNTAWSAPNSALTNLQDGGDGVVSHSMSSEFLNVTDTTQTFYFSLADDMQLAGIAFSTTDGDASLDVTWTLAPTVVTAMLNQSTALTGTLEDVPTGIDVPTPIDYTSGSPHFLRKGVLYSLSVVSSVSSPACVRVCISLTFLYKPRRR